MSATKMLVLGVVQAAGEVHGYQVRRELLSWHAENWANVKPGSIYHALKKAARDGLVDEVGAQPGDSGPDRIRYRITESGVREIVALVRAALRDATDNVTLNAAIAMLPALTRAEAIDDLGVRIVELEKALQGLRDWMANPQEGLPEHVREQAGLWTNQVNAELDWARKLLARLNAGAYTMADEHG
ncbi:PadR family transcriptional regulator [Labedaea rhizosphaerae]|uniref:PadR family transcriptional regulator n=1 Tax=Labedaea rhizosphaerae TaxID=598644 RepID=A0A4R6SL71_LABRH|nr:PadR family transcriptional regulator [Labedaea rhizosphaerae]TDQ04300.1 PadR family transcriptional regulator [Labedaea rhizosphaerae]